MLVSSTINNIPCDMIVVALIDIYIYIYLVTWAFVLFQFFGHLCCHCLGDEDDVVGAIYILRLGRVGLPLFAGGRRGSLHTSLNQKFWSLMFIFGPLQCRAPIYHSAHVKTIKQFTLMKIWE